MPPQTPPHQTVPWALRTRAQRPSWTGPCSLFLLDSRQLSGPSAHVLPTPRRGTHPPLSCAVPPTPALPSSPPQSVFFLPLLQVGAASPGWSLCFVFAPPPQDMCEALWHPCSNGCQMGYHKPLSSTDGSPGGHLSPSPISKPLALLPLPCGMLCRWTGPSASGAGAYTSVLKVKVLIILCPQLWGLIQIQKQQEKKAAFLIINRISIRSGTNREFAPMRGM